MSQLSLTRSGNIARCSVLSLAAAPLIGAHVYNLGYRLSYSCPILHFTGIPCPTCGMTRSFMAIARGDLATAVNYHLLSPIVFCGFVLVVLHVLLELITQRRYQTFYTRLAAQGQVWLGVIAIALSYHTYRLVLLGRSGELVSGFLQSPLGQWLNYG